MGWVELVRRVNIGGRAHMSLPPAINQPCHDTNDQSVQGHECSIEQQPHGT